MKKVILAVALLGFVFAANAGDDKNKKTCDKDKKACCAKKNGKACPGKEEAKSETKEVKEVKTDK